MGLDTAELLSAIEEAFQVRMPDSVAARSETAGDILKFLRGEWLGAVPRGPALSGAMFHRLRRAFMEEFGTERSRIKPSRDIVDAAPHFLFRPRRMSLFKRLGLKHVPPKLSSRNPLRRDFGTFGILTEDLLARNFAQLAEEAGFMNEKELWNSLRRLIADELGVPLEKIRRDSRFVQDLGAD